MVSVKEFVEKLKVFNPVGNISLKSLMKHCQVGQEYSLQKLLTNGYCACIGEHKNTVRKIYLYNCMRDGLPLNIWLFDHSSGLWSRLGSVQSEFDNIQGACPKLGPFTYEFENEIDKQFTMVALKVDGQRCLEDDPNYGDCHKWILSTFLGGSCGVLEPVSEVSP